MQFGKCRGQKMGFQDIEIKRKYRSADTDNIAKSFIEKVLLQSVSYKRAVGFFSSSSLIYTSRGLAKIAEQYTGGDPVIQYVVSPRLTREDVEAISKGYKSKETCIEDALLRDFTDVSDNFEKERLNMIANLIASGVMDIKVAVTENETSIGMYHEKIGLFIDANGREIAFDGSLNESMNAYDNNFERIKTYRNWVSEERSDCVDIEQDFNNLWNSRTKNICIVSFPTAVKNKLFEYKKETYNHQIDVDEDKQRFENQLRQTMIQRPCIPRNIVLYDYQKKAVEAWFSKQWRGIFDMATSTGKTYTAYAAIVSLLKRTNNKMAVIILCPFQHLVDQWEEDASLFNIRNIVTGYSGSKDGDYLSKLRDYIQEYNSGVMDNFFFFCTNASFKLDRVQKVLANIKKPSLLVADEVHNMGSKQMGKYLTDAYTYRLGLSATVERFRDDEGTKQIFDFFGEKCITYTMEQAIKEDKLCKYNYFPIVTTLDDEEISEYLDLTRKIAKNMKKNKKGKTVLTERGEQLAIIRARLVAGAKDKLVRLKEEMKNHLTEKFILVYCGTSKLEKDNGDEIRQIESVSRMLGIDLGMNVGRYTSMEKIGERQNIKTAFKSGNLQVLVAIKCLDEGVNIPGIRTAFILASSTNPREYVQRRGRVLRKADGKNIANIYDFITLPCSLDQASQLDSSTRKSFGALFANEMKRMEEFQRSSCNATVAMKLMDQINDKFKLTEFEINAEFEELTWTDDDYE